MEATEDHHDGPRIVTKSSLLFYQSRTLVQHNSVQHVYIQYCYTFSLKTFPHGFSILVACHSTNRTARDQIIFSKFPEFRDTRFQTASESHSLSRNILHQGCFTELDVQQNLNIHQNYCQNVNDFVILDEDAFV